MAGAPTEYPPDQGKKGGKKKTLEEVKKTSKVAGKRKADVSPAKRMLEREKKYKKYHQMNPLKILLVKVLLTVMMIVKSQFIEQKKSLSVRMIMRWRKRRKRKK